MCTLHSTCVCFCSIVEQVPNVGCSSNAQKDFKQTVVSAVQSASTKNRRSLAYCVVKERTFRCAFCSCMEPPTCTHLPVLCACSLVRLIETQQQKKVYLQTKKCRNMHSHMTVRQILSATYRVCETTSLHRMCSPAPPCASAFAQRHPHLGHVHLDGFGDW